MKSLRILILSELNNPDWVSVPLVGFEHSQALAKLHKVTIVTHQRNCAAILRATQAFATVFGIELGIVDRFYDWAFQFFFKGDFGSQKLTAFRFPYYLLFEWWAWRRLRGRIRAGDFDLVLRLTPVSPVLPSLFAWFLRKEATPFVLGPINGGLPWPALYAQVQRQKELISGLRKLYHKLPFVKESFDHAAAIIVGSSQTYREFPQYGPKLFFVPENGMRQELITETPRALREGPLRLVFVGRLVPVKACDLALRAAASLLHEKRATFAVVGDGEERERLEQWVARKKLKEQVKFYGNVSRSEVLDILRESDVLVFPSIREFGGGVVFEAMALGVVPLVSDYGGPGDIVESSFGYKIPLSDEEGSKKGFRAALEELDKNRKQLETLANQAITHTREHLSWEGKAQQTTEILLWVLGQGPKPLTRLPYLTSEQNSEPYAR